MRRFLGISLALHAIFFGALVLSGNLAARTPIYPPVYRINLVAAPRGEVLRPARKRPRPRRTESQKKPQTAPEPEPKILETQKEVVPDRTEKPAQPEKPRPEPEEKGPESDPAAEEPKLEPLTPEAGGNDAAIDVDVEGKEFPFPDYLNRIVNKIGSQWAMGRQPLHTIVHFRVERTGRVGGIEVLESSGSFLFDQAALRAVQDASPLPPLPDGYTGDYLGVSFDFDAKQR